MRQRVDQQRIELFLRVLGQRFSKPGRIYLVGGTTMVYEGFRQQTLDIDLAIEVDNQDHSTFISLVRELKETLSLNIEEASPADFIPLPSGYRERCEYVGRYGQLDVFHFDLYSTALSKIERGTENDIADVLMLLQVGRLKIEQLIVDFNDILPRYATDSLKQNPKAFQQKFDALVVLWQQSQSNSK